MGLLNHLNKAGIILSFILFSACSLKTTKQNLTNDWEIKQANFQSHFPEISSTGKIIAKPETLEVLAIVQSKTGVTKKIEHTFKRNGNFFINGDFTQTAAFTIPDCKNKQLVNWLTTDMKLSTGNGIMELDYSFTVKDETCKSLKNNADFKDAKTIHISAKATTTMTDRWFPVLAHKKTKCKRPLNPTFSSSLLWYKQITRSRCGACWI